MNCELARFDQWLNGNKLKLNAKKTKYMILGQKTVERVNKIKIGDAMVDRVSKIKCLSCIIDKQMNFNTNCDQVCRKIDKKVTKQLVYNTIMAPYVTYCSTIFVCLKSHGVFIYKVQKCLASYF